MSNHFKRRLKNILTGRDINISVTIYPPAKWIKKLFKFFKNIMRRNKK